MTHHGVDADARDTSFTAKSTPVASVHRDAVGQRVSPRNRVNIRAHHAACIIAYTEAKPSVDTEAVIEPIFLIRYEYVAR